jgi:hypothetical protein
MIAEVTVMPDDYINSSDEEDEDIMAEDELYQDDSNDDDSEEDSDEECHGLTNVVGRRPPRLEWDNNI